MWILKIIFISDQIHAHPNADAKTKFTVMRLKLTCMSFFKEDCLKIIICCFILLLCFEFQIHQYRIYNHTFATPLYSKLRQDFLKHVIPLAVIPRALNFPYLLLRWESNNAYFLLGNVKLCGIILFLILPHAILTNGCYVQCIFAPREELSEKQKQIRIFCLKLS